MSERIRWTDKTAYIAGHVGTLNPPAFRICRPREDGEEWGLTCDLPGAEGVHRSGADEAGVKAEAEKWLEEFIASLGAVFPGGHPEGNAIEPYCATGAGDGDGRHLLQYAVRLPDGTTTAYGDQSWVRAGLGARDHDGASTVVRDIWVSYGPWRTHETTTPGPGKAHR